MTPFIDTEISDPESYETEYFVTPPSVPAFQAKPPRRPGRLRKRPVALIAAVVVVVVPLAILGGTLLLHSLRTEPRDARGLTEREVREGLLRSSEEVVAAVPVYQRSAADYFRATRGQLAMTDSRFVYVGLMPRDVFGGGREPDVFERTAFPLDTLTRVDGGRSLLGAARSLTLERDGEGITLLVSGEDWPAAERMMAMMRERHQLQRQEAERIRQELRAAEELARRPIYHTVERGEAISTIAQRYGITVERLQELNGMTDTRIRVGQSLLVKPDER